MDPIVKVEVFDDGVAICGDGTSKEVAAYITKTCGPLPLVVTDPPYGNIIAAAWDKTKSSQREFATWMIEWSRVMQSLVMPGGAFYLWGGYGTPRFRPFFEYASRVESETSWQVANYITWAKKRGYGVQNNYLSTREELLYMVSGDAKKPRTFHVPYLEQKRGYAGYNAKYPAKSEYFRRTSVWSDITEILSGKVHQTQKPVRVMQIPMEIHMGEDEWAFDPFAGSMTTAWAARGLSNRRWVCVERDEQIFDEAVRELRSGTRKR